ncbi:unnamed protein product [Lepeophtheirus salmonis]|uniref:(salmon louse) hypothetical protein n=1 Tax=Lepeophtheirus salmonis TaxID=72036 RepID=A0A7R8CH58_LEPSM|nr:unnamed protein product [Lepeophtheirus salmonis]CAF2817323.1 unnamed protein product [Lepeophtheirus salmonis]
MSFRFISNLWKQHMLCQQMRCPTRPNLGLAMVDKLQEMVFKKLIKVKNNCLNGHNNGDLIGRDTSILCTIYGELKACANMDVTESFNLESL